MDVISQEQGKMILVSLPFQSIVPSIQLGVLKAYLDKRFKERVEVLHVYLEVFCRVTKENYTILTCSDIGEYIFSRLLLNQEIDKDKVDEMGGTLFGEINFEQLMSDVSIIVDYLDNLVHDILWKEQVVICFSINYKQLYCSLYFAKLLKQIYPDKVIVVGGFGCSRLIGKDIVDKYSFVDYAISGEGELPLAAIYEAWVHKKNIELALVNGIISKSSSDEQVQTIADVLPMGEVSMPDYTPYFKHASSLRLTSDRLYLEASRGCKWASLSGGCMFCNNNLVNKSVRCKSVVQIVDEIQLITKMFGKKKIIFTDSLFVAGKISEFVNEFNKRGLSRLNGGFVELKSTISYEELKQLKSIGITDVQFGIDALSESLLKRMRKGTSVIQNIAALKYCAQLGINVYANIITNYPDTSTTEINETIQGLKYVSHYCNINNSPLIIYYGSPLYHESVHVKRLVPANKFNHISEIDAVMSSVYYENDLENNRKWIPVLVMLRKIKQTREQLPRHPYSLLNYVVQDDSIKIVDCMNNAETTLYGTSKEIYEYCFAPKSLTQVLQNLKQNKTYIYDLLNDMVKRGLVYTNGKLYLSLAVMRDD